eukprot:CAMPEP_0171353988 /NCGR_PEP_ID=MMETSP0878-20121228/44474_1 /TAXON_ID=67004 /ORGANISM="Thalassiosira weissflogii, Strain CCMP1336" /LENGTH=841 /DNA_ID=CAMNT_0011859945 /DNA_START=66 /DNA_END=2592 /DNA_ORIENTATION=-
MRRNCRYRNNPTFGIFDKCCTPQRRIEGEVNLHQAKKNMKRLNKSSLRNSAQCRRAASRSAATSGGDNSTEDASLLGKEDPNQSKFLPPCSTFPPSLRRGRSYGAAFIRSTKKTAPGTRAQKAWKNVSAYISRAASKVSLNKFRRQSSGNEPYESFDSRGTPSPTPSDESSDVMDQHGHWVRSCSSQSCEFSAEIISSEFNQSKLNVFRSLELETARSNDSKDKSDFTSDALSLPSLTEGARHSSTGSELDSLCSIPSLSVELEEEQHFFCMEDLDVKVNQVRNEDVADSVVAWGLLAALMGAPAPPAVMVQDKKLSSEARINLWQDGDCSNYDEIEDIMASSQVTDDGFGRFEVCYDSDDMSIPSLFAAEAHIEDTRTAYEFNTFTNKERGSTATKDAMESSIAWCSLAALLGSHAPSSVIQYMNATKKTNTVENEDGAFVTDDIPDLPHTQEDTIAANFLSSELQITKASSAALLGSHAPSSVIQYMKATTKTRISVTEKFCFHGEFEDVITSSRNTVENEDGAFVTDDIPDLPHTQEDTIAANFLSSELLNYESVFTDFTAEPIDIESSRKDVEDSVLAWSALAALLGSPITEIAYRRTHQCERQSPKNLWVENDADEDDIDMISLPTSSDEDSFIGTVECLDGEEVELHNIPSLNPYNCNSAVGVCKAIGRSDKEMGGNENPGKIDWLSGDLIGDGVDSMVSLPPEIESFHDSVNDNAVLVDCKKDIFIDVLHPVKADDDQSIPSLVSGSFDKDDLTSPLTPDKSLTSLESSFISPQSGENEKEVTVSVLAWSALAAIMGSPAPKALMMRRKKSAQRDLWNEDMMIENEEIHSLQLT